MTYTTPVLLIIFNRRESTKKVLLAIEKIKPKFLYIAADGPRKSKPGEKERCDETKKVTENINWPCQVHRLYRKENLGCKLAVSSAISWFFDNVEEGIILEDDCLPSKSFFFYCQELLKFYRNDSKIMHIGGNNFQPTSSNTRDSYYFSKYSHIWGWATWRRAWKKYEINISPKRVEKNIRYSNVLEKLFWETQLWCVNHNLLDTWDIQWLFSIWSNKGICITPNRNLVKNIGIGADSTHTKSAGDIITKAKVHNIKRIIHPKDRDINKLADSFTLTNVFRVTPKNTINIILMIPYYLFKKLF